MAAMNDKMESLTSKATVFRFVLGPATDVMQAVFQAFYSSPKTHSDGGKMTLAEYQKANDISKKFLISAFGSKTLDKMMTVDLMKEQYDISFYYAAITSLNVGVFNLMDNRSKEILTEIKNDRNSLCHNEALNTKSLRDKLKSLEKLYFELLDVFEKDFPSNSYLQDARLSLRSLITRLKDEPVSIDVYLEEREKFFEELHNKIIIDGREELGKKRPFSSTTDPFSKLLKLHCTTYDKDQPVIDVFTPPWIQSGQQKLPYNRLLEARNDGGDKPRVVFLSGLGGSGKSVLTQIISADWQKEQTSVNNLNEFNFVFKIELKNTCCKSLKTLLCKELLVETMKLAAWDDVFPLLNNLDILFLVDGFDEVKVEYKSLVKEIACLLPNSRILLTTRPEYIKEAQNMFFNSTKLTLDLHGFDIDGRKEFARKVFMLTEPRPDHRDWLLEKFCMFLDTRSHVLQTHLRLPLTIALLIFLWLEYHDDLKKLDSINTATNLHRQLFLMLREKLITQRPLFANVSDKVTDSILHHLQGRALQQLLENVLLELSDESDKSVKDICLKKNLPEVQQTELLSAYLVCDRDSVKKPTKKMKPVQVKYSFSFFHKIQMEYYSAEHVVAELEERKCRLKDCLPTTDGRRIKEVLPFIAGCLSSAGLLDMDVIAELVSCSRLAGVQEIDFNDWFMLVSETARQDQDHTFNDDTYCDALCREVGKTLPDRSWKLKTETLRSGLNLLIHCETVAINEMEIDFRINDDPEDIKDLKTILHKASLILGRRFRDRKIALSLFIRGHSMNYNKDRSDLYLQYFLSWTKLVKFTGHIGPESVRHLTACKNIDVKLASLDGFNALMKHGNKFRHIKELAITANFIDSLGDQHVFPIPSRWKCKLRILFHRISSTSLDRVISFITRCTSDGNSFDRLGVHASCLTYADGVRLFASMQNLVSLKLTVESTDRLTKEQEEGMMRDALAGSERLSTFQAEWNNRPV